MEKNFNKISDFMSRWYIKPGSPKVRRPANEFRAALRNDARIAYRIAKKTLKQQNKGK
jgi:hypothetical protein